MDESEVRDLHDLIAGGDVRVQVVSRVEIGPGADVLGPDQQ
jgi:hypothetical protein